jgi:hypothetical protein
MHSFASFALSQTIFISFSLLARKERIKNVLVVVGDVQSMENRREPQKQEKSFCFSMI